MRAPIAKIRISAGNPGWYDPLTNIHLTITRPEAFVYEGQNVSNIKNAVAFKLVSVIEGELEARLVETETAPVVQEEVKVEEVIEEVREVVTEEPVVEEKAEEVVEEVKEEVEVKEEKPAKKTTKKTAKKKAE